jgi:protein TonB
VTASALQPSKHPEARTARDRVATMLVLAALLHGLVILGITFAPLGGGDRDLDQGIEVVLVSDELPESRQNDSAVYLSQRTQVGSGNTDERLRAQMPQPGQAGSEAPAAQQAANPLAPPEDQVLTASAEDGARPIPQPAATVDTPVSVALAASRATDEALRLRGERRDELYVTADTRASKLAPYLDAWRRRVERIGTINYPLAAQRQGMQGNPVIEVALARDGSLQSAQIIRSSGQPEIDAASLNILRLASPFDPFPDDLSRDYRVLRFAYEWQFLGGRPSQP